jgi:hypothetical protein
MNALRRTLITAATAAMTIGILATMANAGWKMIAANNDAQGHLTFYKERNERGDVRTTTYQYFAGTHIVGTQRTTTVNANGSASVVFERRDRQNRTTFISNEYTNAAGVLIRGVRQSWVYRGMNDTRGKQTNEQYDRANRQWVRF